MDVPITIVYTELKISGFWRGLATYSPLFGKMLSDELVLSMF